jgi:hypothetical protein
MSSKHCKCLERHSDCGHSGTFYECNACGKVHYEGAPDSPNQLANRLVNEAILWPLHFRIAAKLHLQGIRSDEIDLDPGVTPMLLSVVNALKDIESGLIDHDAQTKGIRSLAEIAEEA